MEKGQNYEPTLGELHGLICDGGEQFPNRPAACVLENTWYEHPRKGVRAVEVDLAVLATASRVYAEDVSLANGLSAQGLARPERLASAGHVVAERMQHGLVWGFSGYATAGYSYYDEARGMTYLYAQLESIGALPSLAVDGGMSAGVLGLNGILARRWDVASMGFAPRQGLSGIGNRDHMVVWGNTYQSREVIVGTVPDILVCVGGSDGTMRECLTALRLGGSVLLLALKAEYGEHSFPRMYSELPEAQQALREGRMRVCHFTDGIAASVDGLLRNDFQAARMARAEALAEVFRQELFEQPEN